MANPIVKLDKIGADNHIASFVFASNLANGTIVALGALKTDGESYDATAPADVTVNYMVFHASVPMVYKDDEFEEDFILTAGKEGRGYVLKVGDIVTITDDGINGTTVINEYVIPANGATKMVPSATITTAKVVFKVIQKGTLGINNTSACTTLEVVKA